MAFISCFPSSSHSSKCTARVSSFTRSFPSYFHPQRTTTLHRYSSSLSMTSSPISQHFKSISSSILLTTLSLSILFGFTSPSFAQDQSTGSKIFESNCAACHLGGGNILPFARSKTLKTNALKKNNLYEHDSLVSFIKSGKGSMPAYGEKLSSEELDSVADFILLRAEQNWK
uniref:Cytochrome c-553 n=1 Tax=Timspurckia oligopyrenoides TaxID=708627 RepID=A0A7S1ESS4_9RHOD|mmetsp:Transcript_4595/g.8030  ORF Transcript_4595/g.8030 Transcript_4595/m.8030 type:complete len:172 (+) Transcript_4595:38-553(+)